MSVIRRGLGQAALLVAGAMAVAPWPALAQDDETVYRQRLEQMQQSGGLFTDYAPLEAVPGKTGQSPWPTRPAGDRSIQASALDAAAAYAEANRSTALIVWRNGKLELERYFGDTTPDTLLVAKSLSKPLTAIAIGRAMALGRIRSLDQPVADFITEWRGTDKAAMQLRHLLDMRSGLLEQSTSPDPDSPLNRAYLSPRHDDYLIHHYPLIDPPGSRYGYSNATSELVALVIERATGRRYAEFVGKEILARLGVAGGEIWVDRDGGLAHSGCCMRLPARSWLGLAVLLLQDGVVNGKRLLPKGYVDEIRRGTEANPHYGLGIWLAGDYTPRRGFGAPGRPGPKVLHSEPYLDRDLFLFDGNSNQTVYVSPATRMVILRTGETPPKSPEWDNSKLPNLLIAGIARKPGEALPVPQAPGKE
jgi:CubicO group peptidase (beta-lactamase class C family)